MALDLNDLYGEFSEDIKSSVDSLTMSLPLSGAQLKAAFTDDELTEIDGLLEAVRAATYENKEAALMGGQSNLLLKLVSTLGVAVGL